MTNRDPDKIIRSQRQTIRGLNKRVKAMQTIFDIAKEMPPIGGRIDDYIDWIRKLRKAVENGNHD